MRLVCCDALLYPDPYGSDVAMLHGVEATGVIALQWFSGLIDIPYDGGLTSIPPEDI
jgi:hypothetical protein